MRRNNPPIGEILSGRALNNILADLRRMAADNPEALPAADLPLDQGGLARINVTRGSGNIGLVKRGTDLVWPTALRGPEFQELRDRITARLRAVVKQAEADGRVDLDLTGQLADDVDRLRKDFRRTAAMLPFNQPVEAKKFMTSLDEAVVGSNKRTWKLLNGKFALAATIPDLVKQMADNGLQFALRRPVTIALTAHQSLARTTDSQRPAACNDRQPAERKSRLLGRIARRCCRAWFNPRLAAARQSPGAGLRPTSKCSGGLAPRQSQAAPGRAAAGAGTDRVRDRCRVRSSRCRGHAETILVQAEYHHTIFRLQSARAIRVSSI